MNRPFLDAHGKRGKPRLVSHSIGASKEGKKIRFELLNETHISLNIPLYNQMNTPYVKKVRITKKDGVRLAYWLLDECSK